MNNLKIKVSKCFTAFYIIKFLTVENNIEIVFIELSFIINRLLKKHIQTHIKLLFIDMEILYKQKIKPTGYKKGIIDKYPFYRNDSSLIKV